MLVPPGQFFVYEAQRVGESLSKIASNAAQIRFPEGQTIDAIDWVQVEVMLVTSQICSRGTFPQKYYRHLRARELGHKYGFWIIELRIKRVTMS